MMNNLMKTNRLIFTAVFLMLATTACKKKEPAAEPDRTALLTAKPWKINKILANDSPIAGTALQSILGANALLSQLASSDILFKSDGKFTATDRATGQKTEGTWTFKDSNTKLRLDAAAQGFDFTVALLSDKNLTLNTPYTYSAGGFPITIKATFELIPA